MQNKKSQSGITLIALVVTIVVLLILAGVTIVYVLQDGGIFSSAQNAVSDTDTAVVKEYAANAQSALTMDAYVPGNTKKANATDYITSAFPEGCGYKVITNEVEFASTAGTTANDLLDGTVTIGKGDSATVASWTITYSKGMATVAVSK